MPKPSKKTRPASTAAIAQPVVEDAARNTSASAFSDDALLFAYAALTVDKHRLRVYNTASGQSLAEHTLDNARISHLSWATLNFSSDPQNADTDAQSKKKRKKRNSMAASEAQPVVGSEVVVLGLTDGTVSFFSPSHSRVLRTLSHPSSSTPILAVAPAEGPNPSAVWTSSEDGTVRLWDIQKNDILDAWKTEDRIPYTSLSIRPSGEDNRTDILAAHHSIRLLSRVSDSANLSSSKKPTQVASYTGHASSITLTRWADSQTPPERFVSMAEGDRYLYVWDVQNGTSTEGKASASIPLDSDARTFSLSKSSPTLATLSASGKISVYPIPEELNPPANTSRVAHKLPTILPRSNIVAPSKNSASSAPLINITFSSADASSLTVARLAKGVRPVFNSIKFVDASGNYISDIKLEELDLSTVEDASTGAANQRYSESSTAVVGSGTGIGLNEADEEDVAMRDIDGDLEVDLAELSLGQRLTAVDGTAAQADSDDSDNEASPSKKSSSKAKSKAQNVGAVPANSLTRTLIQALHSSDARLLETCLAHSDPVLIQNTVRRLPPQLAVPLITACTERLGRGGRAANMKGGGGGASAQRGTGLVVWIKTVLAVHAGHLMTIPDLVARLSGLYATITARLALHESLLSLNGKLDMVLSQVELRSSAAPAPLSVKKGKAKSRQKSEVKRYVEGESESSGAEDGDVDVDVDSDQEGSVEDIELGGESDEEDDDEEDDDDSEDDEDEDGSVNGFLDDEAEEWTDDDDDDEDLSE